MLVALTEACFNPAALLGAEVDLSAPPSDAAALFGEGPSTVVLSVRGDDDLARAEKMFSGRGLEFSVIGRVVDEPKLRVAGVVDEDVRELRALYEDALPRRLKASD